MMNKEIIYLITSYLNTQKSYLDEKVRVLDEGKYTCITCNYQGLDLEICVYNETFIKVKVDRLPYAICDGIKSFRSEFDRLPLLRYQW